MSVAPETIYHHLSELSRRRSLDAALELFDTLGYQYADELPLPMRTWPEGVQQLVHANADPPIYLAQHHDLRVIYTHLTTDHLSRALERPVVEHTLHKLHPYALFVFANRDLTYWDFVNVKYSAEDGARRRTIRHIYVGPDERLHTAAQRMALLAVPHADVTALELQSRHDQAFDVEAVRKDFFAAYRTLFQDAERQISGIGGDARRLFTQRLFNRRFEDDSLLGPIIARWRGLKPLNCSSLYEYLVIAIVLQNATVRRSVAMMQALFERYGTLLAYDGRELYCFWEPQAIDGVTEEELRGLKVGYRARSLKRVSAALVRGEVDEFALRAQSRAEQREALLGLYGIGPASVGYILGDVFHHLDQMDHISPWEQKIYSKLFFGREPDDPVAVDVLLQTFDERFGGYRALAVHYVWEDLFWRRKHEHVEWLEELIRL